MKKNILDTSWGVMVAETEDFIFEYSMTREMITNHYVKEKEQEIPYCKMRKQHLRDWPDDTLRIEEEGHAVALSKFPKQLHYFIASYQIFRNSIRKEQIRRCTVLMHTI